MADNRNERLASSRFPKLRRSNPKYDARYYVSNENAKFSNI